MLKSQYSLNGTWLIVYQEFAGREIPPSQFEGHKLILQDSTYTMLAPNADEGIIKVNGEKLDIYGTDGVNNGRHYTAIYRIENNRLTICYNLKGSIHPSGFETAGHPQHFLCVFER
jgi:uncharacterized protein (TIGR03067 family)